MENVVGTTAGDTIRGNSFANILVGHNGTDTFQGSDGQDVFIGGRWTDDGDNVVEAHELVDDSLRDLLDYKTDNATEYISVDLSSNRILRDGYGNITNEIIWDIEDIKGTTYNDTIKGDVEQNIFWGDNGNDTLRGGDEDGVDGRIGDTLYGEGGTDLIFGDAGNDTIWGGDNADTIDGGTGDDNIYSGSGSDTIFSNSGQDVIISTANNTVLDFMASVTTDGAIGANGDQSVIVDLSYNNGEIDHGAGTYAEAGGEAGNDYGRIVRDQFSGANGGTNEIATGIRVLKGTDFDAQIGSSNNYDGDTFTGSGLYNETFYGRDGDDVFYLSNGQDYISGDGDVNGDWVSFEKSGARAWTYNATSNITQIGQTAIVGIENFEGSSGNDTGRLTNGDNVVLGQGGNDTWYGIGGADTIDGGTGNDVIYGGDATNNIGDILSGGDSNVWGGYWYQRGDRLDYWYGEAGAIVINWSVAGNVNQERDYTVDIDAFNGATANDFFAVEENGVVDWVRSFESIRTGNSNDIITLDETNNMTTVFELYYGNDQFYGSNGWDWVYGGSGNDTLEGRDGSDSLYGGNGNDIIRGELGDDRLQGDNNNDTLYGGTGRDVIYGNNDSDRLYANTSTADGDGQSDSLYGGNGNDTLYGFDDSVANVLDGGANNDLFVLDFSNLSSAKNSLDGNSGTDRLQVSGSATVTDGQSFRAASGTDAANFEVIDLTNMTLNGADSAEWNLDYAELLAFRGAMDSSITFELSVDMLENFHVKGDKIGEGEDYTDAAIADHYSVEAGSTYRVYNTEDDSTSNYMDLVITT
jgi:Ca2+-binding RTX toxin-like protein